MLHTSPYQKIEIKDEMDGVFGTYLFFVWGEPEDAEDAYQMSSAAKWVHYLDEDDVNIIEASMMFYEDDSASNAELDSIIREVQAKFDVDEETACDLLDESIDIMDEIVGGDWSDNSWWLQWATARAAKALGYDGVEVIDEQGSAIMVDCAGWKSTAIAEL